MLPKFAVSRTGALFCLDPAFQVFHPQLSLRHWFVEAHDSFCVGGLIHHRSCSGRWISALRSRGSKS